MKNLIILCTGISIVTIMGCNSGYDTPEPHNHHAVSASYTCPMHPAIIRDKPGQCPICGMNLVKKELDGQKSAIAELDALLKPTNEFVVSSLPVTVMFRKQVPIEMEAFGTVAYDTRQIGSIASSIAGRIEKLYVRYRYQQITKGQKILDIYSPELLTAQQNLVFLLANDASNTSYIAAAKDKLLLLGMSSRQLQELIATGIPSLTISVYSKYSGHIHESTNGTSMRNDFGSMKDISLLTEELALKEGMYLQKGQAFFTVFDPSKAWAILHVFGENQGLIKVGNPVRVIPEAAPNKGFDAIIHYLEPFYSRESKTLTARVYFNNQTAKIPIGTQVRATISGNVKEAYWLPKESVLSLGLASIVFEKVKGGFKAKKIITGIGYQNYIQVVSGITLKDSVAVNAQYLMDSESFIKVKD